MKTFVLSCEMEFVSFNDFLKEVPVRDFTGTIYNFNAQLSAGWAELTDPASEVTLYSRHCVALANGSKEKIALATLLPQLGVKVLFKRDLMHMVEDLTVNSLENFGNPTRAVRLSPRLWMIANPEDFGLVKYGNKYALACYFPNRTVVAQIERVTEEQMIKAATETFGMTEEEALRNLRKS